MRSLLAVVVFGACASKPPVVANHAPPIVAVVDEVKIDPNSIELDGKRRYWKKWGRAYISKIPGPICICEQQRTVWIINGVESVGYTTTCSTYR